MSGTGWRVWSSFFTPVKIKALRIYWSGQACALIGMWLQVTSMGILVYHLSHGSGTAVGLMAALNAAPFLFGGMLLGSLGDHFERRKLLIVVQIVQILVASALCILGWTGLLALWHLFAATFILGIIQCIAFPTQQAFVGDLVPRDMLLKSISMYSLVFNICRSVGPPLGGFVIGTLGENFAFGINALCNIPMILCLITLGHGLVLTSNKETTPARIAKRSSPGGLATVWGHYPLKMILLSAIIQNLFGQSMYQIVPALTYGSPSATASLLGAVGTGAVASILFVMPFAGRSSRIGLRLSTGTLWMACMFITAGIFPNIILQTGCFFLAGLATSALFVTTSSTVQLLAPSHQKSTILGLFTIVTIGAQPLAALWWGALLDQIGVPALLILVGSVQAILSILMLCQKRWITWSLSTNV